MEFHWSKSVCICRCVTDNVCVRWIFPCVSGSSTQLCCFYTHLLAKGGLISQSVGFCSRSGFNTCYYRLSCCHPLHTAGPCPLCSLCLTPTSLTPGERSDPIPASLCYIRSSTFSNSVSEMIARCLRSQSYSKCFVVGCLFHHILPHLEVIGQDHPPRTAVLIRRLDTCQPVGVKPQPFSTFP